MTLKDSELLVVEGAEDFDTREDASDSVVTNQVKDTAASLTLRSSSVLDAINNYWGHKQRNPRFSVRFRFLSTSQAGFEQNAPFGKGIKGLDLWGRAALDARGDLGPLRQFLLERDLDRSLADFVQNSSDSDFREHFLRRIEWDLGQPIKDVLIDELESRLVNLGASWTPLVPPHAAKKAFFSLINFVEAHMESDGDRTIRRSDLMDQFENAVSERVPFGTIAQTGQSSAATTARPATVGAPTPIVTDTTWRAPLTDDLHAQLTASGVLLLSGSSGVGKTTLAALVAQKTGGNWGWVSFRNRSAPEVREILSRTHHEVISGTSPTALVLDDMRLSSSTAFERELLLVLFSISSERGKIIITSSDHCSPQLLVKGKIDAECCRDVPYFSDSDIRDLLRLGGLEDDRAGTWAKTIMFTTSGHPQLVHARVRSLKAKSWPRPDSTDLTLPEDVQVEREATRARLIDEIPSQDARELAYRLSVVTGSFSRSLVFKIAAVDEAVQLPGEQFDLLRGPWVEEEANERFRISPLLSGAAKAVLPPAQVKRIHETIVLEVLQSQTLDQYQIGTAMSHALLAESGPFLAKLSMVILETDRDDIPMLEAGLIWFPHLATSPRQTIHTDNPYVEFFLRLAQYSIASNGTKPATAVPLVDRILEALDQLDSDAGSRHALSELTAYGTILNTITVPLPSRTVVALLVKFRKAEQIAKLPDEIASAPETASYASGLEGLSKSQILFSFHASRGLGIEDFADLLSSLEELDDENRKYLLEVFNKADDFASLLVSNAWWSEVRDRELDVDRAVEVFERAAQLSEIWKVPKLSIAALIAVSVVHDEYGNDPDKSRETLDHADNLYPSHPELWAQRAKVEYHAKNYDNALDLFSAALDHDLEIPPVEKVYGFRMAGISAARNGDWTSASKFFDAGAKAANELETLVWMRIGLLADAAFALWKGSERARSVQLFSSVLNELGQCPINEELQSRHVHATIAHTVAWLSFNAVSQEFPDHVEPIPGTCSHPEPHEGLANHEIVETPKVWGVLAALEVFLGVDYGIRPRALEELGAPLPISIDIQICTMALEGAWDRADFTNLPALIIEFVEATHRATKLRAAGADGWSHELVEPMTSAERRSPIVEHTINLYLLSAAVTLLERDSQGGVPARKWRAELSDRNYLPISSDALLTVLDNGNEREPDGMEIPWVDAAYRLMQLSAAPASADELFICHFRLLELLGQSQGRAEASFDAFAVRAWRYAAEHQRFAFVAPGMSCAQIIELCDIGEFRGFSRIAAILEVAADALRIQLADSAKEKLRYIVENGRTPY